LYYYDRLVDGTPATVDGGATMLALCKALQQYGIPPESAWPYDVSRFSQRPPASADTQTVKIESYSQVQGTGLVLLQGTWAALQQAENDPSISIVLALDVYPEFENSSPDGKKQMPGPWSAALGGHAIEVTDWSNNTAAPGGYGYVGCQGSWGQDFDDSGYHWLPAGYFTANIVREVWVIKHAAPVPPVDDNVDVTAIRDKLQQLREMVAQAQADRCAYDANKAQYQASMVQIMDHDIGPIYDVAQQIEDLLPKAPEPTPEPTAQFVSPIPNGAVYGQTKWLPGSLGCDLFIPRGTSVVAPADCVVEEVIPGVGLNGGAEVILALPDKSWAWRYRHVQATVTVGQQVSQGQQVAAVGDSSLDQLGPIPSAWRQFPFSDGWQHLDLSVNQGTDQFAPTGGGGGNVDASSWMQGLGYQGTLITRTPGPPDSGH
jgi:hypothetical protein